MAALQYVDRPDYAALLLRRTYADLSLPGALMDRANEWWRPTAARWNDREKTWLFPSGAKVTFGYLETENDKYRYQGAEFQFLGLDEATQFSESQYRYLLSRLRRKEGSEVPLRARCASNPGGVGHEWVKARFVDPGDPDRPFIPAKLEDNPSLDREEYEHSLAQLDPVTRAQLRSGNWDVLPEGRKFRREWFRFIEPSEVPPNTRFVRFWDLAATEPKPGKDPDWTAGAKVGLTPDQRVIIADVRRTREAPGGVEAFVTRTASEDGKPVPITMEQEPGSSGVMVIDHYRRRVLMGYSFHGQKSTGDKEVRANPVSAQAEGGNVYLVRGNWNAAFLDEVCAFPTEGVHDDQVDAVSGGFTRLTAGTGSRPATGAIRRT
jgi:predicted phage terminase large subunit-like protein